MQQARMDYLSSLMQRLQQSSRSAAMKEAPPPDMQRMDPATMVPPPDMQRRTLTPLMVPPPDMQRSSNPICEVPPPPDMQRSVEPREAAFA